MAANLSLLSSQYASAVRSVSQSLRLRLGRTCFLTEILTLFNSFLDTLGPSFDACSVRNGTCNSLNNPSSFGQFISRTIQDGSAGHLSCRNSVFAGGSQIQNTVRWPSRDPRVVTPSDNGCRAAASDTHLRSGRNQALGDDLSDRLARSMRKLTSEGCSLAFLPRSTDGVRNQSAGHDHHEGVTLLMNRLEPFRRGFSSTNLRPLERARHYRVLQGVHSYY